MDTVTLRTIQGHEATICLHGAHVKSWTSPEGQELLFVSKKAVYAPPKAIRGGIPICFPQFGMMGPMTTQHGFARNTAFEVESKEDWKVTMVLRYDGSGHAGWPHPCLLRVTTSLCENMFTQELQVHNTGSSEFQFTAALHTYFRVQDITKVRVTGLSGVEYLDSLSQQARRVEEGQAVTFGQEVDRVYMGAPGDIQVHDEMSGRVMNIQRVSFPDAVVWNPWVDKAKSMADFGDEEYKEMLCIEPAVAASGPISVSPGASWSGKQILTYSLQTV